MTFNHYCAIVLIHTLLHFYPPPLRHDSVRFGMMETTAGLAQRVTPQLVTHKVPLVSTSATVGFHVSFAFRGVNLVGVHTRLSAIA